jgi:hypothetical protein
VLGVERPAIHPYFLCVSTYLFKSLGTVVVHGAQGLKLTTPEQVGVTMVRDDMVGHAGRHYLPVLQALTAQRVRP